jgi:hypothetical protein
METKLKPLVHYIEVVYPPSPVVGKSVIVKTVDHPSPLVSNTKHVLTSPVVSVNDDGFETQNSIYVALRSVDVPSNQ